MMAARRLLTTNTGRCCRSPSFLSSSSSSNFSTYVPTRRPNEAGPGGRSSDAGVKVAVFGASGFLGRYVSCVLGTNGVLAYIGNRGDDMEMRYIKTMFDLGRLKFVFYSPRDIESMKDVIGDADIVINLIGKYYESKAPVNTPNFPYVKLQTNYTFEDVNVTIPRTIAELCKEMQIDNLIHVSSAAANPDSSSEWARTKYEGELAVKEAYPWATIIRPTQFFGVEDRLLNFFPIAAGRFPIVPLIDGGHSLTQPVYVVDVAETIGRVVDEPHKYEGKRIDCFGPSDYTYEELSKFVFDITGQQTPVWEIPKSTIKSISKVLQYERYPFITPDLIELWTQDYLPALKTQEQYDAQTATGNDKILTMKDLHVNQTPIEKEAFNYLHRFRQGGHFSIAEGYHG